MRAKITKFYQDVFDDAKLHLVMPTTRIFFTVGEGETYSGSFLIESKDHRPIRGMVYTSTFRMQCKGAGFDSDKAKISFVFDSTGLKAGDMLKGTFTIVSEAGEYDISFTASIALPYVETRMGKITSLEDFKELASYSYREALNLFMSPKFKDLLAVENDTTNNLYDGIRRLVLDERSLEEFLIGTDMKKPVQIYLMEEEKFYPSIEHSMTEVLELAKDSWGFVPITVAVEGDFIKVEKESFTTMDFEGNRFQYEYTLVKSLLHAGKNYGAIVFKTPYGNLTFRITVMVEGSRDEREESRMQKVLGVDIVKRYIRYRCGQIPVSEWCDRALDDYEQLEKLYPGQHIYTLLSAHALIECGRKEEARHILERFDKKFWSRVKDSELWGFYIYLASLVKNDLSYSMKVSDEIRKLHEKNEDSWILLWLVLQTEEYLIQNVERRVQIIENQWKERGFHSVLLLEAYLTMMEQPGLIEPLTPFSVQVLVFAKRKGLLTNEMATVVSMITARQRVYSPLLLEVLEGCYQVRPARETLSAICRYLILGHKTSRQYFKWYEKGVQAELHIANLYEYYMYSVDEEIGVKLPQTIYLYFSRENSLDTRKIAFLYANLIRHQEYYPELLQKIRDEMSDFARNQLRQHRISKNLKVLYKYFLPEWDLSEDESEALADILYTYEFRTENKRISHIVVLHNGVAKANVVPCNDGVAYVRLYTKADHLVLQDKRGNIYIDTIPYKLSRMFYDEKYITYIQDNAQKHIGVLLNACESDRITEQTLPLYERLAHTDGVREKTKRRVKKSLLWYAYDHGDNDRVQTYLKEVDQAWLDNKERSLLLRILLSDNQLKKAYDMIRKYGYQGIDITNLVEFCSRQIRHENYRENTVLLSACMFAFLQDKYDEVMLDYLCRYYCGKTSLMKYLWKVAYSYEKDTHALEERILIQMLFCEEVIGEEEIFYNYYIHGANDNIKKAYLSYKAYGYFVKNKLVEPRYFEYIETEYARNESINTSCQLACLKYYADQTVADELVRKMLDEFLVECRTSGFIFSYFQKYDEALLKKLSLTNRLMIQYQGNERSKVSIYYHIGKVGDPVTSFETEIVPQSYHTYFMKEFLLFKGEEMRYFIVEENDEGSHVVEVGKIRQDEAAQEFTGRFAAINRILTEEYPDAYLEEYERKSYLVDQLYKVL